MVLSVNHCIIGSYADVKLARDMITKQKVALKIYEKNRLNSKKRRQNVLREIQLLRQLDNENIIKLYTTIDTGK